jgi:hypothetical protein
MGNKDRGSTKSDKKKPVASLKEKRQAKRSKKAMATPDLGMSK